MFSLALFMASCYGLEDENFKELAKITVDTEQEWVYTKLGETCVFDLPVESERDLPMSYEWCYGPVNIINGGFPNMTDSTFISNERTINKVFTRMGDYVLRLKVDNGESILFKYFRLRVASGLDEGVAILCDDGDGSGSLTFVKSRTPEEIANDEQEIWEDVFSLINPGMELSAPTDMYLTYYTAASQKNASFIVTTGDDQGSVYKMDPRTFEVTNYFKMQEMYETSGVRFAGEAASTAAYYGFILGENGNLYRYDLAGDAIGTRSDCIGFGITRAWELHTATNATGAPYRDFLFANETQFFVPGNGVVNSHTIAEGYEIVNVGVTRIGTRRYHIVLRHKTTGEVKQYTITNNLRTVYAGTDYTPAGELCMDSKSVLVNTNQNSYAYYVYNNKIYRWNVSSNTAQIPTQPTDINIPAGEQIISMGTNGDPEVGGSPEDLLYVATYNPDRTGENKGSLYIFRLSDHVRMDGGAYEGICKKPIKVLYKYPVSI